MAVRKAVDDKIAREDVTGQWGAFVNDDDALTLVGRFPFVQYETATSKVAGEEVAMRRVVLTGPWEVVRD